MVFNIRQEPKENDMKKFTIAAGAALALGLTGIGVGGAVAATLPPTTPPASSSATTSTTKTTEVPGTEAADGSATAGSEATGTEAPGTEKTSVSDGPGGHADAQGANVNHQGGNSEK